jgi:hypothetical protein
MVNYPAALPAHDADPTHGEVFAELVAVATELGTTPSGPYTDVKDRLDSNDLLAHKSIDLTGYEPPTQSSVTPALVTSSHTVTFTVPDTGWIRVTLSGLGWVGGAGVKQNWCLINMGTSDKLLRSEMTVIADTPAQYATYELVTDMAGQTTRLTPGATVTLGWGWLVPADGSPGTISFDNSVSSITVQAVPAPADTSTAPGASSTLTTPENVATVGTSAGASVNASWAAQPQAGDLLLAVFMANVVTASWVLPAGWALARGVRVGTATARYVGVCWKVAGGSEPTSLTFTGTAATLATVHMWSKRGFTTTPTVELTEAASYDSYTSGNYLTASSQVTPPKYAVGAIGQGSGTEITIVGNGFDVLYNDGAAVRATAASDKTTHVSAKPRLKPAMASSQSVGAVLAVFTGV